MTALVVQAVLEVLLALEAGGDDRDQEPVRTTGARGGR
jgi:hypothetical protein